MRAYQVQQIGRDPQIALQIATRQFQRSGGKTALTITIHRVDDGISVQVGKQAWMGVAASLGETALRAIRNPFSLIGRLDDIAQDIESLQLSEEVWEVIERTFSNMGLERTFPIDSNGMFVHIAIRPTRQEKAVVSRAEHLWGISNQSPV